MRNRLQCSEEINKSFDSLKSHEAKFYHGKPQNALLCIWKDNKSVPLLSTILDNSMKIAEKWDVDKQEFIKIPIPSLFANYRKFMGE